MELFCLGLNHRTAPVEVREKFAVGTPRLGQAATELALLAEATESVVISTCNRTEFYLAAADAQLAVAQLEIRLTQRESLDPGVTTHFYHKVKVDAAHHLCRVVSGLDSMLLGETEIFGQVKAAYHAALEAGATGAILNRLFQRAFGVGKKVRTETSIQEGRHLGRQRRGGFGGENFRSSQGQPGDDPRGRRNVPDHRPKPGVAWRPLDFRHQPLV
jgi:glutamyl-tRNA reductase